MELAYLAIFPKIFIQEKQASFFYKTPIIFISKIRGKLTYKESKALSILKKRTGLFYKAFKTFFIPNKHAYSFYKVPTIFITEKKDNPPYKTFKVLSTLKKLTNSLS